MRVDVRKTEEVIIVDLQGRLVSGTGDQLLREVMNELLAASWTKILLNLSEVTKIDSAGIGELVASIKLAERFSSQVKLLHVRGQIRDILELSQILPLLEVYDSEESALQAFEESDESSDDSE
ncbi:MAG: STAS domain-containing protein [bacterium]|nr:STAS domain-containing protein [bacterium]